jgi:lipoyl(octanoyl) transferase
MAQLVVTNHHAQPAASSRSSPLLRVVDLGVIGYRDAYAIQLAEVQRLLDARQHASDTSTNAIPALGPVGTLLLLEHPPVITISRRAGAAAHLKASPELLARDAISLEETDRGGDITYHGPGQLVVYPILDLNRLHLRLHDYMRALEEIVINVCRRVGVEAHRDPTATGVWVRAIDDAAPPGTPSLREGTRGPDHGASHTHNGTTSPHAPDTSAKVCAMGVRIRQWISMHGLAINVSPNLTHFDLIVPCGLPDRRVTSLAALLGDRAPSINDTKALVIEGFGALMADRLSRERS